jgi:hypothetical protein
MFTHWLLFNNDDEWLYHTQYPYWSLSYIVASSISRPPTLIFNSCLFIYCFPSLTHKPKTKTIITCGRLLYRWETTYCEPPRLIIQFHQSIANVVFTQAFTLNFLRHTFQNQSIYETSVLGRVKMYKNVFAKY